MTPETLTVEIFRDSDREHISPEIAESGIEYIRRLTTGIAPVRAARLLKIANSSEATEVRTGKIRWPKLEADLNVVLTDRQIKSDRRGDSHEGAGEYVTGVVMSGARKRDLCIAMINVDNIADPSLTVAHETAHLLGLKRDGEKSDHGGHCVDDRCLMYAYHFDREYVVKAERKGVSRWLEKGGLIIPEYVTATAPNATEFCEECAMQVDKQAFYFKQAKAGHAMFDDLI